MQKNTLPLDNYDGMILCRRPTSHSDFMATDNAKSNHDNKNGKSTSILRAKNDHHSSSLSSSKNVPEGSFLCGTVPTPWGNTSAKIKSEKKKVMSRISKNDGALSRHKQWLKEMEEKRDKKIKEEEEKIRLKNEKSKQFMEKQARRRQRIRQLENESVENNSNDENDESDKGWNQEDTHKNAEMRSGEKRCRPVWSLTECEAKNVNEIIEAEEEEELMDFVDGLDFDQYFHDMELKVLMTQVKDRVRHLEKQKSSDASLLNTVLKSEASEAHNEKYNNEDPMRFSNGKEHEIEYQDCGDGDHDIRSIAQSIRSNGEGSISSIHSHKSMQMLVSKSRDRLESSSMKRPLDVIMECNSSRGEIRMKPPITITHTEDNGARLAETKSLNKLPFKNRNPAL